MVSILDPVWMARRIPATWRWFRRAVSPVADWLGLIAVATVLVAFFVGGVALVEADEEASREKFHADCRAIGGNPVSLDGLVCWDPAERRIIDRW